MALENGTRRNWQAELPRMLNEFNEFSGDGGENRALGRSCENAQQISNLKLAERVGHLREPLAMLAASAPSLVAIHHSSPEFAASGGGWRREWESSNAISRKLMFTAISSASLATATI